MHTDSLYSIDDPQKKKYCLLNYHEHGEHINIWGQKADLLCPIMLYRIEQINSKFN